MKEKWDEGKRAIYLACFAPMRTFTTSTGPLKIQTNIRHTWASGKVSIAMLRGGG